jgi:hypothetical protein
LRKIGLEPAKAIAVVAVYLGDYSSVKGLIPHTLLWHFVEIDKGFPEGFVQGKEIFTPLIHKTL